MVNRWQATRSDSSSGIYRRATDVFPSCMSVEIMERILTGKDLVPRIMERRLWQQSFVVPDSIPQLDGLRGLAVLLVLISQLRLP